MQPASSSSSCGRRILITSIDSPTGNKSSEGATHAISQIKDNPNFTINAEKTTSGATLLTRLTFTRLNSVKIVSAMSSLLISSLTSSCKLSTEKKSLRRFFGHLAMLSFVTPLPSPPPGCYLLRVTNEVSISGKVYRASDAGFSPSENDYVTARCEDHFRCKFRRESFCLCRAVLVCAVEILFLP